MNAATLAVSQKILATDYDMIERLMARLLVVALSPAPDNHFRWDYGSSAETLPQ